MAAASAVGLVACYLIALGTPGGRRLDASAFGDTLNETTNPHAHEAAGDLLHTIDISSLIMLGAAIVALGLLRRRPALALAAGVAIAGANLTSQGLKHLLGNQDPFGLEALRGTVGTWPSGHSTVAMSLALGLVVVSGPAHRTLAAVIGAAYAVGVGVATVALGWHYPSDVVGGFLVAAMWTALCAAGAATVEARQPIAGRPSNPVVRRSATAGAALLVAVAFLSIVGVAVARRESLLEFTNGHTTFVASAVGIAALGIAVVAAYRFALGGRAAGT
jgi:hypothetical protein